MALQNNFIASTLGTVKDDINNNLDRTLSATEMNTFLLRGILRIERELRIAPMETTITWDSAVDATSKAFPDDYLETKDIWLIESNDAIPLKRVTYPDARRLQLQASGSAPIDFATTGLAWVAAPHPRSGDTFDIIYYARFPAIVNDTASNWLTLNAPDLWSTAAIYEAYVYFHDNDNANAWLSKYNDILAQVQSTWERDEYSGSDLQIIRS